MANVLVVDDDPDIASLIQIQLLRHGHRATTATSGEAALGIIAEEGRPDVAVLDMRMPGMSGKDLLRELRSLEGFADLPVIFLTGVPRSEVLEVDDPGCAYITKPFTSANLLDAIVCLIPLARSA